MSKPISSALLALNDECRNHTMEYRGMVIKLDAVVYDALLRENGYLYRPAGNKGFFLDSVILVESM